MVLDIEKSELIVITQNPIKIKKDSKTLYIQIPDEITEIMELNEKSLLEIILSKVENKGKEFE